VEPLIRWDDRENNVSILHHEHKCLERDNSHAPTYVIRRHVTVVTSPHYAILNPKSLKFPFDR
jgi:hypothetical protein